MPCSLGVSTGSFQGRQVLVFPVAFCPRAWTCLYYAWFQAGSAGNCSGAAGWGAARRRPCLFLRRGVPILPQTPAGAPPPARSPAASAAVRDSRRTWRLQPWPAPPSWPPPSGLPAAPRCTRTRTRTRSPPDPTSPPPPQSSPLAPPLPGAARAGRHLHIPIPPLHPCTQGPFRAGAGQGPDGVDGGAAGVDSASSREKKPALTALLSQEHQLEFSQRVPKISPCGHGAGSRGRERRSRRSEGAGRGEEEGEGGRPAVREPEGEGRATRVPGSPAAPRPQPAAACPAAAASEEQVGGRRRRAGSGLLRAARAAALWTPKAQRGPQGAGGAGRGEARGGGRSPGPRDSAPSRLRRRLRSARSPASDVMRGPRGCGAAGLEDVCPPTPSPHPGWGASPRRAPERPPDLSVSCCPSTFVFPTLPF